MRFARPLQPGDRIGVTAPSSGIQPGMLARLDVAVKSLEARGYDVVLGECLGTPSVVSAPKEQRAAELTAMLADPAIRAVVPPWGGELAIDLLDRIGWESLAAAEPTWLVGFSDITTLLMPVSLRLGWATLHGANLMDSAVRRPRRPAALDRDRVRNRAVRPDQPGSLPVDRLGRLRRPSPRSTGSPSTRPGAGRCSAAVRST